MEHKKWIEKRDALMAELRANDAAWDETKRIRVEMRANDEKKAPKVYNMYYDPGAPNINSGIEQAIDKHLGNTKGDRPITNPGPYPYREETDKDIEAAEAILSEMRAKGTPEFMLPTDRDTRFEEGDMVALNSEGLAVPYKPQITADNPLAKGKTIGINSKGFLCSPRSTAGKVYNMYSDAKESEPTGIGTFGPSILRGAFREYRSTQIMAKATALGAGIDLADEPDKTTHQIVEIDHIEGESRITSAREVCKYAMPQPIKIDGELVEIHWPRYDAPYPIHEDAAKREMVARIQRTHREFPICEQSGLPVTVKVVGEFHRFDCDADGQSWMFQALFVCDHCGD